MKHKKRMIKIIALLAFIIFVYVSYSQEVDLWHRDESNLIDFNIFSQSIQDSINKYCQNNVGKNYTLYFNDKLYMTDDLKENYRISKSDCSALFYVDTINNIFKFFDNTISSGRIYAHFLFIFKENLFFITGKNEDEKQSYISIYKIDKLDTIKEYIFKQQDETWFQRNQKSAPEIYIENGHLKIGIVSYEKRFYAWWLIFFAAPRGAPSKWQRIEESMIPYLYTFDENLNCISVEKKVFPKKKKK